MTDHDYFTSILDDMIDANAEKEEVLAAGKAWVEARSAIIDMPMNSPDWRARLNRLSEAENNLVRAIREPTWARRGAILDVRTVVAETRCQYCDNTGDVHRIDGEWLGYCTCPEGVALKNNGTLQP